MALSFDGVDDLVSFGDINALDTPAALSVAYWIQPKTGGAVNDAFVEKKTGSADGFRIGTHSDLATTLAFTSTAGTVFATLASGVVVDVWAHHLWVYDGAGAANADRLKLWIDGVAQTLAFTGTMPTSLGDSTTTPLQVSKSTQDPANFAPVYLAHLLIWTAALLAAAAEQQRHLYRPVSTTGLVLWSPLDDGTFARDYSGAGNHGVVTGALQIAGPPVSYGGDP